MIARAEAKWFTIEMETMDDVEGGSRHSIWFHPSLPGTIVTLAGSEDDDEEDAKPYQERIVQEVIERIRQFDTRAAESEEIVTPVVKMDQAFDLASHYAMVIEWSAEDDAFVVCVPDLPGLYTHGTTREEAVSMGKEAIELWLDCARQHGVQAPAPRFGVLASPNHAFGALWSNN